MLDLSSAHNQIFHSGQARGFNCLNADLEIKLLLR